MMSNYLDAGHEESDGVVDETCPIVTKADSPMASPARQTYSGKCPIVKPAARAAGTVRESRHEMHESISIKTCATTITSIIIVTIKHRRNETKTNE
jgi:hypothetical protein